jgi:hypothetical protein
MKTCPRCGYSTDKKIRSNNQNKYYWGVIIPKLSELTGYTKDEIHEILKFKFLSSSLKIWNKSGEFDSYGILKSTTDLDTKEFETFLSEVREWASIRLNCFIPEPNEEILNG